jgi:hypothetical protein
MLCATSIGWAGVFIDFETLPDGSPTQWDDLIGDSYAPWGVTFGSVGVNDMPRFRDGYNADGMFANTTHASYPPGFNIIADLTVPVYTVSADVMSSIYDRPEAISKPGHLLTLYNAAC